MSFRTLFLLPGILLLTLAGPARAGIRSLPLSEAATKGIVRVEAISKGGYNGVCLHLDVQNMSSETVRVEVEPGLIYTPPSDAYQHLVCFGGEVLEIVPQEHGGMDVRTFCGKSQASSPARGLTYRFWRRGDEAMKQTLAYLRTHKLQDDLGQRAVWAITSGHSLSSVWDGRKAAASLALVTVMARLLNQRVPQFFTEHRVNTSGPGPCFVRTPDSIVVPLHWDERRAHRAVHAVILRPDGTVYRHLGHGEVLTPQSHSLRVTFKPRQDPPGEYTVRLYDDENYTWQQVRVPVAWD